MDGKALADAMGHSLAPAAYEELAGPFNEALLRAQCTTVNRAAMFCAQVGHESRGLYYREEIASGAAYEGRKDLGNTRPGDGKRYKGRGPIQLTGAFNYQAFSRWANGKGLVPTATYFYDNPTLVGQPRWGLLAASWYWTVARARLNSYADAGDIVAATKAVNGGLNGLADRTVRWNRCRALGVRLLPTPTPREDDMAAVPQDQWDKVYRQESAVFDYSKHHGAPVDDQLGHTLSIRKELAELRKAVAELAARLDKS